MERYSADDFHIWVGLCVLLILVLWQSKEGPIGERGPQGEPGVFNILGTYPTNQDFLDAVASGAVATGAAGEFWLIEYDGSLWTWSPLANNWVDVGDIRGPSGPSGASITGATGATGPSGGSFGGYYGSFSSTVTQTNLLAVNPITHNVTELNNGPYIDLSDASKIRIPDAGIYKFSYSIQTSKTGGSSTTVQVWARQGSGSGSPSNVPRSASQFTLKNLNDQVFLLCEYISQFASDDYFQFVWKSTDSSVVLLASGASGSVPAVPSIITNVYRVG